MDSLWERHQIQAIRQAISEGRLDAEKVHQAMLDEISKELDKSLGEVNMDYVNACDKLLTELNHSRAAAAESHYASNLTAIRRRLRFASRRRITAYSFRFGIACCLVVILVFGGTLFSRKNFEVVVSPNEEQLIIQGVDTNSPIESRADAMRAAGIYDPDDWSEALFLYGSVPMAPAWLPDGFAAHSYNVDIIEAYKTITIIYQNEARDSLVFLEKTYRQMEAARREIEQYGYGNTNLLQNGMTIYIASNYELRTANWSKDNVNCTFYGGISESDLLKCLESIEFEKEK